jgi:type VI secretion system protein ImpH
MASESGRSTASVKESLYERPSRFEFFQAVRLLRRLRHDGAGIGEDDPDQEALRFRSEVSLSFPARDIAKLEPPGEGERAAVMTVAFLGMATAGSFGSLPTRYTEEILEQERQKNFALRDFFDLFNHRFVSLFYRAWEKYRLPVQYEVSDARFFERALSSVIGMGTEGLAGRIALEDRALLSRAGLLAMAPLPEVALAGVLESYFGVPVEVEQFLATWYPIDEGEQNRLGAANSRLGEDLFVGDGVCLAQFKFGLRLGPLDWQRYQEFFPTAEGFHALVDLVRLAVTPEVDFQTRPILRAEDVPALRLEHTPSQACRLGWSTWLKSEEFRRDPDDAVLVPESRVAAPSAGAAGAISLDSMEGRP